MQDIKRTASSEFGTYRLCEQRRFRRACASAQSRQNLRCSLIQAVSQEEPSDRKPDPWPLWMPGHAQLKFVMTECSKTQIRLTGLKHHFPEPQKERKTVIEDADPDIIIGTETGLDSTIGSAEILPYQLGYDIQRRDRPNDAHGGVLIAAKSLQLGEVEYSTGIEFISASITAGRNDIGNWTCIHYLQYVQSRWGLRTPNMLLADYPTLLTWRGRYVLTRLKTSRWLLHIVRE